MSARNGDRSRFHRERKQKIARRKRTHELVKQALTQREPASGSGAGKSRKEPA